MADGSIQVEHAYLTGNQDGLDMDIEESMHYTDQRTGPRKHEGEVSQEHV